VERPISIHCPDCDAKLNIKDAALLGRTVKCPKCGESFTAEAPAEPEVETCDLEQEPRLPPLPTRRATSKAAKEPSKSNGKKSRKTSNPSAKSASSKKPLLLIAGGGAAALLMLLAGAGVVIWMMSGRVGIFADESPESKSAKEEAAWQLKAARRKELDPLRTEAQQLRKERKLPEAVTAAQRLLARERELLGDDAPDVVRSLEFIAECYEEAGNIQQARATRKQNVELQTKLHGRNDWRATDANLALAHFELLQKLPTAQRRELADARRVNNQAENLARQGSYPAALEAAGRAAEVRKRVLGDQHRIYAASLNNMAYIYQMQGDYARAEPLYRQAAEIRKKVLGAEHPNYALSLNNLASLHLFQGDYARAEILHRQALEIRKKALGELHPDYAQSLTNLALLYKYQGDYTRAEPLNRQAAEIFKKALGEQHADYAKSLNELALLYQFQADYARAEPLYRQALEVQKKALGEQHPDYARTLGNLGLLYQSQEESARAEPLYRQALEIRKKALGEQHPDYANSLHNLAALYQSQGDSVRAEPLYRQAAEIQKIALGERHPHYAYSLHNLASLYQSQGDSARAEPLYRQALEIRKNALGEQHPAYATSLSKLGLLLGTTEEGKRMSAKALGIMRELLDRTAVIQSERQQLAMARQISSIRNGFISVARLGAALPANVYSELLPLKGLVSARQQELRLVEQQAAREPDSPAAKAFSQLIEKTRLLAQLSQLTPEPQAAAAHQKHMREVHDELEEIQHKLSKASAPYRQAVSQRARTSAALAAVLPKQAALVDLIVYGQYQLPDAEHKHARWEEQIAAFIVRPDRPVAWAFLGPAESIGKDVEDWRKSYGLGESAAAGTRLRQQLWEPLEPFLEGIDTVLISPDGPLCGLPWGALPGKSSDKYLIEEHAFAVVPIPQILPQLLAPAPKAAPPTLLLVGDIDYGGEPGQLLAGASTRAAVGRERDGRRMTFARLKAGPKEIASIRDTFRARFPESSAKARTLGNTEATEAEFRKLSPGYRWLHVVTHGYFAQDLSSASPALETPADFQMSAERPARIEELAPDLLSGIALTGANQPARENSDDGILTALEVSALDLHQTEMVVLSACETGLGRAAGGEGVLGLQRAFQLAGTRTVVASLWQVDDKATEVLMQEFYEKLWKQKLPKLEALRQAQLSMLRAGAKRLQAKEGGQRGLDLDPAQPAREDGRLPPYYWAAFVLSGDWR